MQAAAKTISVDERRDQKLRRMLDQLSSHERIAFAALLRESLDVAGRTMPHNEEAEAAVISAVLTPNRDTLDVVLQVLPDGGAFYSDAHRRIYDAAIEVHTSGQPVDVQTVAEVLKRRDRLQAVGGLAYLSKVIDTTPSVANVAAHARIVRDKARVRRMIETCQLVAAEAYGDYGTTEAYVASALDRVSAVAESAGESRLQSISEIGRQRAEELREQWAGKRDPWGMRGPHAKLHAKTQGHGIGEQTYVAADTSGGKSAYALQNVIHLAQRQYAGEQIGCAYLSLEMPSKKHYDRGILQLAYPMALEARLRPISMRELQTGREDVQNDRGELVSGKTELDPARVWLIQEAIRQLDALPIEFDDAGKDLANVRSTARIVQRRLRERGARLRFLVVDHLHIMRFPDARREDEAIAKVVNEFNELAKDLELHMLVLAQFNRDRAKVIGPPRLEHIRGASAIEQIAHKVFLIYRPWAQMTPQEKREATLEERRESLMIIAKNRDATQGSVPMDFIGEAFRFEELDEPGE